MTTPPLAPPPRPTAREERAALVVFLLFSPRLRRAPPPPPPSHLAPFERFEIPRGPGRSLSAMFFPAPGAARGAVLFLHPWVPRGQSYFHRSGRIDAARAAGYHAMTFDFAGFGDSTRARGFFDGDVEAALAALRARTPGLPLHVWGVSAGGNWAHAALARDPGKVAGGFFEDVSPHLFEWSQRMAPFWSPAYRLFRALFPTAYRFMDLRGHAPHVALKAAAYVSGADDPGVMPEDTRELAALTGGEAKIVAGAAHLGALKVEGDALCALALRTFAAAEEHGGG